jgi:DNA-binding response OmpR family regulator
MSDKILIVDDNPHVLKLLRISLEKAGYAVLTAENGDKGLQQAEKANPDLIISDVMMPQTDGIEFCWMIRENSSIPMVPFIFLTSLEDRDAEIRGFRAGADEYLVKPVDRKILLDKVELLLNRIKKIRAYDSGKSKRIKGFEGNLEDLSMVEVIQLLNQNKRSGTLEIKDGYDGKIVFEAGNMIFAQFEKFSGVSAVNKIITVKKGFFRFTPSTEDIKPNIEISTMNVLLDALRLMDESMADAEEEKERQKSG